MRKSKASKKPSHSKASFIRISIGIHAVREALKVHPQWAVELWMKEGFESSPAGLDICRQAKARQIPQKIQSLKKLNDLGSGHQGVALLLKNRPELNEERLASSPCVCLALDQVSDPHNLGAILRSAWLFNVAAVFTPTAHSASLSPTVSKVSQGGVEHVALQEVSRLDQELLRLKDQGFWVFGLSHRASKSLFEVELPEKVVWVLGSEGEGLRKPTEKACDELLSIPQAVPEASFNVSVAAGLALAESHRQLFFSKASK